MTIQQVLPYLFLAGDLVANLTGTRGGGALVAVTLVAGALAAGLLAGNLGGDSHPSLCCGLGS